MSHSNSEIVQLQKRLEELEKENQILKEKLNGQEFTGNTVKTPKEFKGIFDKAQETVKEYFSKIDFSPAQGNISINEDRYVLIRASSLSFGFFQEIKKLYRDAGDEEAFNIGQNFLFDIGHVIGKEDARHFHKKTQLDDPIEKLSTGPVHFAHSGWAFVDILPESKPSQDENFFLKYHHPYSFEAHSWIEKGELADRPVCIMNAAYSSGWCEESFGMELTAVEISCKAKGDDNCAFIMAPPERINDYLSTESKQSKHEHKVPVFFERKHIEGQLKSSLAEKETLLKEIHHRVKNNLQVITSLLNLQFKNIKDKEVMDAIAKSKHRINSMALIHSKLYQSNNLASIDFGSYVEELVESIASSYTIDNSINCKVKYSNAFFNIDLSINLGLIINELITNAFKHAFSNKKAGSIEVELNNTMADQYQLIVRDDGMGIPKEIDIENPNTFGLEIVTALTNQIDGEITIDSENGFECMISFKK